MASKETFGFGDLTSPERDESREHSVPSEPLIRRSTGWIRATDQLPAPKPKRGPRARQPQPGGFDALQDSEKRLNEQVRPVNPEDRARAQEILDQIGKRFSANRQKGKSNAYERYQSDLAENLNYLVTGGVMNLKEISQTIMQLEEYRKQSSEHGKTPATILAEWLQGSKVEEVK